MLSSTVRFYIVLGAIGFVLFQIWLQYRDKSFIEWVWMLLMGSVLMGIWFGLRRRRRGRWKHSRKIALGLLAVGLVGATAVLCTVDPAAAASFGHTITP